GDRRRTDAFLLGGRAAPLRPAAPRLDGAGRPEPPGPPAGRTAGGDAGRSVSRTAAQPVGALPGCPLSVPRTGQSAVRLRRRGAASADLHLARTGTVAGRGTFPGAITAAQPRGPVSGGKSRSEAHPHQYAARTGPPSAVARLRRLAG